MRYRFLASLPVILALSTPVAADPTVGLGLTFTWGGGARGDTGIGLRVFSNDERKDVVGTLGVDYMLGSQSFRPNVGIAYLARNSYVGMDVGYDFGSNGVNVGVGLGAADTKRKAAAVAPPPPPT